MFVCVSCVYLCKLCLSVSLSVSVMSSCVYLCQLRMYIPTYLCQLYVSVSVMSISIYLCQLCTYLSVSAVCICVSHVYLCLSVSVMYLPVSAVCICVSICASYVYLCLSVSVMYLVSCVSASAVSICVSCVYCSHLCQCRVVTDGDPGYGAEARIEVVSGQAEQSLCGSYHVPLGANTWGVRVDRLLFVLPSLQDGVRFADQSIVGHVQVPELGAVPG